MGASDGVVKGFTKLLDNGPNAKRLNIVVVAEGFTETELPTFRTKAKEFVTALKAEPWYPIVGHAINVHALEVASTESGLDDPATCADGSTGSGTDVKTYFDSSWCAGGVRRGIAGDRKIVTAALGSHPWEVALVLVNTTHHGGYGGGGIAWTSIKPGWVNTALHELGHAVFGLGDEYQYKQGCGSGETGHDFAPSAEPYSSNLTVETTRAKLKWRNLVDPAVPIPTMLNPDCTKCDHRPNVLADDDTIGLYEGAGTFHCVRFRPAYRCRMRNESDPFCEVCVQAIVRTLGKFVTPTPRLEVVPQQLDFGDVAHGLTLHRSFEVRNRRVGMPGELEIALTPPTGPFSLAAGTPTTFTLPAPVTEAYTKKRIYVAFTSTSSGGPSFIGQVTVAVPYDPTNSPATVGLTAEAVTPPPVDSVLVVDRSGSMDGATGVPGERKFHHAIKAARLYVALLKDNDQIGVVRYNHLWRSPQDILQTLRPAGAVGSGAGRLAARNALNQVNLKPDGYTSIGGGIQLGSSVLDTASAASRALVVLTDGIQNRSPDIPTATAAVSAKTPRQRVFAVGLGLHQLENKLKQIASVTNGFTQITGDLAGDKEFLLQKLYVQILSDVNDQAFVKDPYRVLYERQRQPNTVEIGEVDVAADFIVVFRPTSVFPSKLDVWLEAPDGTLITNATAAAKANVDYVEDDTHVFYRVLFPVDPEHPEAHVGTWRIWLENNAVEQFTHGVLHYSTLVTARSDLLLRGNVVQASYTPGSTMRVVLEPTLYGQPVALDPPVEVHVERPDGVDRTVALTKQDEGSYAGDFRDTALVGPYLASTAVQVTTRHGTPLTRVRNMTGLIYDPISPGGRQPAGDPCEEAQEALRVLAELVERCCSGGGVDAQQEQAAERSEKSAEQWR